MRIAYWGLVLAVEVAGMGGCGDDGGPRTPHIDSLAPAMAAVGGSVDVLGRNFCGETGAMDDGACTETVSGFVAFGAAPTVVRAQVTSWKDTRIQIAVPAGVSGGVTTVVVTVDGIPSNAADFEVLP